MHPTDHLENLPVAVVNDDVGVMSDGEALHVGDELVENLKESEALGWDFVDSSMAMEGLQNNDYYMVIVIPEEFSKNVTTLTEPDPKKLQLKYIQNEGLNFTAATITDTAASTIGQELEQMIIQQFATEVLDQVGGGLEEAADGSEQLADGTTQLQEGTTELNESVTSKTADIERLASGSQELKAGTNELLSNLRGNSGDISRLAAGSKELHEGTGELRNGTGQVLSGLQQAKDGSTELNEGLTEDIVPGSKELAEGSTELAAGSVLLANGVEQLVEKVEPLLAILPPGIIEGDPAEQLQELKEGATQVKEGAQALEVGANQLHDGLATQFQPGLKDLDSGLSQLVAGQNEVVAGVSDLQAGAAQIADGNAGVRSGWNELTSGASQLDDGASQIAEGNAQVNEGWKELASGSTELNDGATQLDDGSHELAEGLKAGVDSIAPLKDGEENIEMFASPVELAAEQVNSPEYYRDTTAPFVMTLGLFVGILVVSLFMNFTRPAEVSPARWFVDRFVNLSVLGIIQAVLLLIYAFAFLQIQATNSGLLVLTLIVAAITFSAIVLFLAAIAGNIGRFIAVAFVLMQVPTTGGDLPIVLLGDGIKGLTPFFPFKYSIAGIRTSLMLGNTDQIFFNIFILLIFAVIALVLTYVVYLFKKDKDMPHVEETSATPGSAY